MTPNLIPLIIGVGFAVFGVALWRNPSLWVKFTNAGNRCFGMRLVVEDEVRFKRFVRLFAALYVVLGLVVVFGLVFGMFYYR